MKTEIKDQVTRSKVAFLWLTVYGLQLTALLSLASCAATKAAKPAGSGYTSVLQRWTREGKVYADFETNLLISATFKSKQFRESYIEEYSLVYMLNGEKLKKLVKGENEALNNYHEFFVSIHTPLREWSDLERKESIWAVYLINDAGDRVSPLEIKKVKERGPTVKSFYPYLDDWSVAYTIKFPLNLVDGRQLITADTKYVALIITGPSGKGELTWKLKP